MELLTRRRQVPTSRRRWPEPAAATVRLKGRHWREKEILQSVPDWKERVTLQSALGQREKVTPPQARQRKEKEIHLAARQNSCGVGTYKGRPLGLPERSLYGKEYAESRSWR
jgi:hypothetical protein